MFGFGWLCYVITGEEQSSRGARENRNMLEHFFSNIEAYLKTIEVPADGTVDKSVYDEIQSILDQRRSDGSVPSWVDAYRAEQLLCSILPEQHLCDQSKKRLGEIKVLHKAAHPEYESSISDLFKNGKTSDPKRARGLLLQMLNDAQWRYAQKYHIRRLTELYSARIFFLFMISISLLGLSLILASPFKILSVICDNCQIGFGFSGFCLAISAGLVGASFSTLIRRSKIADANTIEMVKAGTSFPMIFLRLGAGAGAAAILYFFFEAGLIDGTVFPNLKLVGFSSIDVATVANDLDAALAEAGALVATMQDASPANADLVKLAEHVATMEKALGDHPNQALSRFVPNPDLSLLIVWSYLAGFSEQFVPMILGRVENSANKDKPE
jgi:hypothetical protein